MGTTARSRDWTAILSALAGIETTQEPTQLTRLSLDYYHFSPVLQPLLQAKRGDLVVRPTTEAQVVQVAQVCVQHRLPLTVRGAGTGNYGQCVPLAGGIILDMSAMPAVRWVRSGVLRVEAGAKLAAIDRALRPQGWELRMVPSTYRTATIGGFIGGGSGGIGSITYGQLRDRGNLLAARVVTLEDTPRVLELRGDDVQKINHAYGTNGIITELEVPLASATEWVDLILAFPDFLTATRFSQELSHADGILKKLVCVCAPPIPRYFTALQNHIPLDQTLVLLMVAPSGLEPLKALSDHYGGTRCYEKTGTTSKGIALGEYTWNHTTLHARSADPNLTYLQVLYPADPELTLMAQLQQQYGDEMMMHLEFVRLGGAVRAIGLPLVRYTTTERLNAIMADHEAQGALIFNPHTYLLEDGGMKQVDPAQLGFKEQVDPYGLLNPGKMRGWLEKHGASRPV